MWEVSMRGSLKRDEKREQNFEYKMERENNFGNMLVHRVKI
jgi:hypothetical protein